MNIRISRKWWVSIVATLALLALAWGVSRALAQSPGDAPRAPAGGSLANTFTYQGRLLDGGQPVSGTYDFQVAIWDSSAPGSNQVATCPSIVDDIAVVNGVFTLHLVPDRPMNEVFTGDERWIDLAVRPDGTGAYSPIGRQPIAPTPYAWGLRSGAVISGTTDSGNFGGAVLNIKALHPFGGGPYATALYARSSTSSAVRAESGGVGVYGSSTSTYAIRGEASAGTAGYFTTDEGYGVYGETQGTDHWDHGGYFTANMGYGVYGVSAQNYGVRGDGGPFGVRGDGTTTGVSGYGGVVGVRGGSSSGYGVEGSSTDGWGVYGHSTGDHGVHGYSASDIGVVGVQSGYSESDLGTYYKPGGLFGGMNGVVGITKAAGGYGVFGWDKASSGGWAGMFVSANGAGVYITAPSGHTGLNVASGTKSAVVRTDEGSRLLYTEESTEVWFADYGFARLEDGLAVIPIDELFAQTVNLEEPYHVFVQVYGDAQVYVANRTPTQFEVHLRDGDPDVEFSYRIAAKRLGYEDDRLEAAPWADDDPNLYPEKAQTLDGQQGGLQSPGGWR